MEVVVLKLLVQLQLQMFNELGQQLWVIDKLSSFYWEKLTFLLD